MSDNQTPAQASAWTALRPAPMLWNTLLLIAALGILITLRLLPAEALWAALLVLALLTAQQAIELLRLPLPTVERDLPNILPLGVQRTLHLRIRSKHRGALRAKIHDGHPSSFLVQGLPAAAELKRDRDCLLTYFVTPTERGEVWFANCQMKVFSSLNWLTRKIWVGPPQTLKIYPNFAPLAKLALIGAEQASRVVGAHVKRKRGDGTEFQQLREYRAGDSMRQIEWKASQRAGKLISREYQEERNQKIILALDTGRRMMARDGDLSHFDHTLNAALVLAHMALRQGDAVGLQVMGSNSRYVAPKRGIATIDQMLNTLFDVQASTEATDYLQMFNELSHRQSRRSLVVLITNIRDEDIDDVLLAVTRLRRKHLVCVASLREQVLEQIHQEPVKTVEQALRLSSVANYLNFRERAHDQIRAAGVDLLDVNCPELPGALVEHYLRVKRSGRL